jgi:hypothetical protein
MRYGLSIDAISREAIVSPEQVTGDALAADNNPTLRYNAVAFLKKLYTVSLLLYGFAIA